jgi:hypothetical protein
MIWPMIKKSVSLFFVTLCIITPIWALVVILAMLGTIAVYPNLTTWQAIAYAAWLGLWPLGALWALWCLALHLARHSERRHQANLP